MNVNLSIRSTISFLLLCISYTLSAQNLVPNPSFEMHDTCPDLFNQIERAISWSRYRGSPDYFNSCDTSQMAGVPQNGLGYAVPSDGQAYAGVITYLGAQPNVREYIGAGLIQPLSAGNPVYISFKAFPGINGSVLPTRLASSGIGVRFSNDIFFQGIGTALPLPNTPIYSQDLLTDTTQWTKYEGYYTPDSAYQYIQIGNFYTDSNTLVGVLDSSGLQDFAYVFIDEVCVAYDSLECLGNNYVVENSPFQFRCYPNPVVKTLYIEFENPLMKKASIELYGVQGEVIRNLTTYSERLSIDLSGISLSLLILRVSMSESVAHQKIIRTN